MFALALTVSEIITFKIVTFKKVGCGHGAQFWLTPFDGK